MPGIGDTLRDARLQAGLEITDFETRTKIRAKYLRALEDEEWSLLPGYTYTKGFLRTYADMLGLDGRALVDEFKRQYRDPSELEPAAQGSGRRADPRRARERPREHAGERSGRSRPGGGPSRPPIIVAVVVLIVLIGVALYAVGVLLPRSKTPTTTSNTTTIQSHSHTHSASTGPTGKTKPHRRRVRVVGVQLLPTAPVYVCMVGYPGSANNRPHVRIRDLTLIKGGVEPTYHDNHFRVTLGNGQIVLVVDGHRHQVAPSATPIHLEITLHGRILPLKASEAPTCG
jgi:hypothetical protein